MVYDVTIDGKGFRLELERAETGWQCRLNDREVKIDAVLTRRDVLSVLIDGKAYEIKREHTAADTHLWVGSVRYLAELRDPRSLRGRRGAGADDKGPKKILAPMPGKVIRVLIDQGQPIEAGQSILVVEAMKMQNEIKSPKKGTMQKIMAVEGATVNAGDVLAIVE
ncbi:MAG TPA: acetyl-CoA carboxylase biotin carboxyl carrier protein subunit [Terriglobales bacterium]|jgi:biotin carboxyl carrier protein|nr:acetyl-CoA carboxylase biotin carboxyl carrier protein subunit [Terriglobales bacterium]